MKLKLLSIQKSVLYATLVFAFTGSLLSVSIGPINIFPFRVLLILMWLFFLSIIFILNAGYLNLSHIKVKRCLQLFALWFAYAFLSIMWSADPIEALKHIIFLFTGVSVIFFIVYFFRGLNDLILLYWLLIFIFIALMPIGIWEITTGNHLESSIYTDTVINFKFMPTTVFLNPNNYAAYIVLTLPMILAWTHHTRAIVGRALGIIIMIVSLLILLMTLSRSCYIAFFMGFTFWIFFLLPWRKRIGALVFLVIFCIFFVIVLQTKFADHLSTIKDQVYSLSILSSQDSDMSSAYEGGRLNLLKNGAIFFIQSWGFGVGAGNSNYYMANHAIYPVGDLTAMHNWWMEILVNYGVFIFFGYVFLYINLFWNLWRAYKRMFRPNEKMICEALLVGLVSFFMASISASSAIAFMPQWVFLGFALAFLNYTRITKTKDNPA